MTDEEKAASFANRLYRDPGVLAVAVGEKNYLGSGVALILPPQLALAGLAAASHMAGTHLSLGGAGIAELDIRSDGYKALAICYAEHELVVSVVIRVGHPVSKSLQRMVRRALKTVYGITKDVPTPVPSPVQDAPTAEVR